VLQNFDFREGDHRWNGGYYPLIPTISYPYLP
jgi:hypothetical protein